MARTALAQRLRDIIAILIFSTELSDVFIASVAQVLHEIADAVAVHRITKLRFRRNFIALGYSHVAHVVIEPGKLSALPIVPGTSGSHPKCDLVLHLRIQPVTYYQVELQPNPVAEKTALPVHII